MATIFPTSVPDKRLSETISSSASSFKITSITGWNGVDLTSADFGTKLYAVFRNSTGTLMEIMQVDPATITSATASITILLRGLKFTGDLTTEVSANKLVWVKGDTIVSLGTHVPQLLKHYVDTLGDQTIAGVKTFTSQPVSTAGLPTGATDLATKQYVDNTATGTTSVNRTIVAGTAGETILVDQLVYLKASDGRWWLADADAAASSENVQLGIAQGGGTAGVAITSGVLVAGLNTFSALTLTANTKYYVSNTAGGFSSSVGTKEVTVGQSQSTTTFLFSPRNDQEITEDQQDAMTGSLGTPSLTNRYVTEQQLTAVTAMAAQAVDGTAGSIFTRTLASSETFTQSGFTTGRVFMVEVKQGAGTSYTVTWFAGITWITAGATAPVQTTTTNGTTTYGFRCTGTNTFLGYLVSSQ